MRSNHEFVRAALASLTESLPPFVERELQRVHGDRWLTVVRETLVRQGRQGPHGDEVVWDAHYLLAVLWDRWHEAFKEPLGFETRSVVSELRRFRNVWAHQGHFDFDDTYRVIDNVERLLRACRVGGVDELARMKHELLRDRFGRAAVRETWGLGRRVEISVFVVCGAALGLQVIMSFGSRAWPVALLAGVSFTYILVRRLLEERRDHHVRLHEREAARTRSASVPELDGTRSATDDPPGAASEETSTAQTVDAA